MTIQATNGSNGIDPAAGGGPGTSLDEILKNFFLTLLAKIANTVSDTQTEAAKKSAQQDEENIANGQATASAQSTSNDSKGADSKVPNAIGGAESGYGSSASAGSDVGAAAGI